MDLHKGELMYYTISMLIVSGDHVAHRIYGHCEKPHTRSIRVSNEHH